MRSHPHHVSLAVLLFTVACSFAAAASVAVAQPVAESLGDRITRWWPDPSARANALPSLTLLPHIHSEQSVPPVSALRPSFPLAPGGRAVHIDTPRGTSLYGTGMVPGRLWRNGTTTTLWNTDAYRWSGDSPSLYQSHPWVLAVRGDGSAFGVIADEPGRMVVDLTAGITFRAQGAPFAVIVIERGSPDSVVMALGQLTGTMPLPPRWALGWQQCRYSYSPDSEVVRIGREYRERKIPCDVLWMDIDYQEGNRSFTFSRRDFPDPNALNDWLHTQGFRSVWIVDPGIKREPGYSAYDEGSAGGFWVQDGAAQDYIGKVWPGPCVFPDVTRAAVRAWWGNRIAAFAAVGADGIWNDMDEPAVFDVESKTMPETNVHRADPALGGTGTHRRFHNAYGMLLARASYEGLRNTYPDRRPFVLSRANFLGGQKWAAAWTGDNASTWAHLKWSVPMTLNLGLSGQPFAGADIGGFAGMVDRELFARWVGVGALLPFARAHSEKGTTRKEPWSFGPLVEATCRRAIETRYRLLPYLYTVFQEASQTGLPVARPVFFADPRDAALRKEDQSFLLGADLLVVAQLDEDRSHVPILPRGNWRDAAIAAPREDGSRDPDLPRTLVREGAIVPLGPVMLFSDERPLEEVTLLVNLDGGSRAFGTLYEDAGDGFGHERGEFRLTRFEAHIEGDALVVREAGHEGAWQPPAGRRYTVRVLDDPAAKRRAYKRIVQP